MNKLRSLFLNSVSVGIHDGLSEEKKLALRIALLDAYWSLIAMSFYTVYSFQNRLFPAFYIHLACFALTIFGTILLGYRRYDFGRILIHQVGLVEIFLTADAVGVRSGYEFYYFTSIAVPFITFTFEEQWKATMLTTISCSVLLFQQIAGHGLIMDHMEVPPEDRMIAILFVMSYVLTVFTIGRIQLKRAHKKLRERSEELMKASNLIVLGEMSAGIAHEINNPLQSLSLNLSVMKEKFPVSDFDSHYVINDNLIRKLGKMVQNLKDLSRDDSMGPTEDFHFSKMLEDVLSILSEKIKKENVQIFINGDSELKARAHLVQIQQVMINLLNNSLDAVSSLNEKWVRIEIISKSTFLQVTVTDSGKGIPEHVASNMMKPFYSTKFATKGTGLGLSISKNICEKNNGSLFYDPTSTHTKFVVLIPKEGAEVAP